MQIAIVLVGIALLYAPAVIRNGYVDWDDIELLEHSRDGIREAFSSYSMGLYTPLSQSSLYLEHAVFGSQPAVTHGINLLLHLICVALVWYGLKLVTKRSDVPFIAAALWGMHPINTETVLWTAARKDLLMAVFFLSTWILYQKKSVWSYLTYAFACLSKATAVSLPLTLSPPRAWKRTVPFFLIAFLCGLIALHGGGTGSDTSYVIRIFPKTFLLPLQHILIPRNLSAIYTDTDILWYIPFFFAFVGTTAYAWKKYPTLFFGMWWYAATLAPNLLNKHSASAYISADHYAYLPSIGIVTPIAILISKMRHGFHVAALFMVVLGTLSYQQSQVWRNTTSLFLQTVESGIESDIAYNVLAEQYNVIGNPQKAVELLQRSLNARPNTKAYYLLGRVALENGRVSDAINFFEKALNAKTTMDNPEVLYADYGAALLIDDNPLSIRYLEHALRLDPQMEVALDNLKTAKERFGD